MSSDILNRIAEHASSIAEKDLDEWVVPGLMGLYSSRIDWLARQAYSEQRNAVPDVAVAAFREHAQIELRNGTATFLFKSQLWKEGRDINSYLLTCLNRLAKRLHWDNGAAKKANLLVCPICKLDNRKEFLIAEDKLWRCSNCTEAVSTMTIQLDSMREQLNYKGIASLESKFRLHKIFSLHSRKGYRCLDCNRFIPESINTSFGIACPYDDCVFMGRIDELEIMPHPVALSIRQMVSLNETVIKDDSLNSPTIQDRMEADVIRADVQIDLKEQNEIEYQTLVSVIEEQIEFTKRMNSSGTMVQKILMYESFKIMLEKFPEEMMSYLVHRKQNQEFPIQYKIFQLYAGLLENYLPFSIKRKNETIDILDLTDPNLSLFLGISTFETEVKSNFTIPNKTTEMYTGSRKFKCYGSCFIGKVIDVTDIKTGRSIKDHVKEYNFVQIKMDETILPGTLVKVQHYRIQPHYEMDSLVFLQRIRRHIVDRVYFKINKKKREPGS